MMKWGRFRWIRPVLVLWLASGCCLAGQAQSEGNTTSTKQTAPSSDQKGSRDAQAQQKTPLTPAEQRRADLLADTEKLYQLTQELKAEVSKSNKDTLSVSVVKKAQEVERLAKSIKERSRNQ
jgi:hypothetical protein